MSLHVPIRAVTLDFFNTLVFLRSGRGRGPTLMEYLEGQGFRPAPWEHQVLYDVFALHDRDYSPSAPLAERRRYHVELAARVFERLRIPAAPEQIEEHAPVIWKILGPDALQPFADVQETLRVLREGGLPLAVVSNWQCGLRHFCQELGLADSFDHILGSADLGVAKPDPGIFHQACARLGVAPGNVLHVGDTFVDDHEGARAAGLPAVLLARYGDADPRAKEVLGGLEGLPARVAESQSTPESRPTGDP